MKMDKVIRNSAICLLCNEELESKYTHDFVRCSCGNLYIDGGKAYLKRGASDFRQVEETSIVEEYDWEPDNE